MCWDESWEDQWLMTWWEPGLAVSSAPPPPRRKDREAGAAVREAARLAVPRRALTIPHIAPAIATWLRHRRARPAEPEVPQELIPTGRR
jgi:hypothetical protein